MTQSKRKPTTPERNRKQAIYNKLRTQTHPELMALVQRKSTLKAKYDGMTLEDYDFMCRYQNNCCAICSCDNPGKGIKNWHIDHDHVTGAVRGLLCSRCNLMLGKANDNPYLLDAAADYLRKFNPIQR
jgi:hypothetical protein